MLAVCSLPENLVLISSGEKTVTLAGWMSPHLRGDTEKGCLESTCMLGGGKLAWVAQFFFLCRERGL